MTRTAPQNLSTASPHGSKAPETEDGAENGHGHYFPALPLALCDESDLNPRRQFAEEPLQELAASIAQYGVLQPLLVRTTTRGRYEIVAGSRRSRAARLAGQTAVPAVLRDELSDVEVLAMMFHENYAREDLNAIEIAEACQRAVALGLKGVEIARKFGISAPTVSNHLRLLRLPESVQELVRQGRLRHSAAEELAKYAELYEGADLLVAAAELTVERALTVEQLRRGLPVLQQSLDGGRTARFTGPVSQDAAPCAECPFHARLTLLVLSQWNTGHTWTEARCANPAHLAELTAERKAIEEERRREAEAAFEAQRRQREAVEICTRPQRHEELKAQELRAESRARGQRVRMKREQAEALLARKGDVCGSREWADVVAQAAESAGQAHRKAVFKELGLASLLPLWDGWQSTGRKRLDALAALPTALLVQAYHGMRWRKEAATAGGSYGAGKTPLIDWYLGLLEPEKAQPIEPTHCGVCGKEIPQGVVCKVIAGLACDPECEETARGLPGGEHEADLVFVRAPQRGFILPAEPEQAGESEQRPPTYAESAANLEARIATLQARETAPAGQIAWFERKLERVRRRLASSGVGGGCRAERGEPPESSPASPLAAPLVEREEYDEAEDDGLYCSAGCMEELPEAVALTDSPPDGTVVIAAPDGDVLWTGTPAEFLAVDSLPVRVAIGWLLTPQGGVYCPGCVSDVRMCRACGCTSEHACEEGCYWIEPDLCSNCRPGQSEAATPAVPLAPRSLTETETADAEPDDADAAARLARISTFAEDADELNRLSAPAPKAGSAPANEPETPGRIPSDFVDAGSEKPAERFFYRDPDGLGMSGQIWVQELSPGWECSVYWTIGESSSQGQKTELAESRRKAVQAAVSLLTEPLERLFLRELPAGSITVREASRLIRWGNEILTQVIEDERATPVGQAEAAPAAPVPNEQGIYPEELAERLEWPNAPKARHARILLLELPGRGWIEATCYQTSGAGSSHGLSERFSKLYQSRLAALRAAVSSLCDQMWHLKQGGGSQTQRREAEKIRQWAWDVLGAAESTPEPEPRMPAAPAADDDGLAAGTLEAVQERLDLEIHEILRDLRALEDEMLRGLFGEKPPCGGDGHAE
jgi:ParB/RepB/Spo0J family partition protein